MEKLDGAALRAVHRTRLRGKSLVLSVVGEMDPKKVLGLISDRFGKLPGDAVPGGTYAPVASHTSTKLTHQDSAKAQAHVVYGFPGTTITDDPDRFALEVLSTILSGQGGRLFVELRDKRGLAYRVSAFSVEGVDPGYFAVYIATSPRTSTTRSPESTTSSRNPRAARRPRRARARRSYLIGSHAIGMQKNASRAAIVALDQLYGLGAENHLKYEERILAVDAEALRRVAQRFIRFDQAVLAVLGPKPADDWAKA